MSLSFSFELKELIKENLEKTNFQRVFTSSVEESKELLISTDKEFIIFILASKINKFFDHPIFLDKDLVKLFHAYYN